MKNTDDKVPRHVCLSFSQSVYSLTTWVSQYQKCKTNLDFTEAHIKYGVVFHLCITNATTTISFSQSTGWMMSAYHCVLRSVCSQRLAGWHSRWVRRWGGTRCHCHAGPRWDRHWHLWQGLSVCLSVSVFLSVVSIVRVALLSYSSFHLLTKHVAGI